MELSSSLSPSLPSLIAEDDACGEGEKGGGWDERAVVMTDSPGKGSRP